MEKLDIQKYMAKGVRRIVKEAIFATSKNDKEAIFIKGFVKSVKKATKVRFEKEKSGKHIPPFLIASITSSCNLHCAGCYSRSNNATTDCKPVSQLTGEEWMKIFLDAKDLGISFILLAGGEPMLRRDVIKEAGKVKDILFPIFTNGTFLDDKYCDLFDECRNLVPVMSIEGGKEETDARRGDGIYERLIKNMDALKARGIVFGASVTITKENLKEALSVEFLSKLEEKGCKAVFFIEYVPVTEESKELAPTSEDREYIKMRIAHLRKTRKQMLYIAFPGDEKTSGGCLAAGRGFFHINSHGGAEPCPFSSYSDINIKDTSLIDAIDSKLFTMLRDENVLIEVHEGGCVLFEKRDEVERIMAELSNK